MYRAIAQYVYSPSPANEMEVTDLVQQYREQADIDGNGQADEHEWAMNFR